MTDKLRPVIVSTFSPPALACIRSWGRQGWEPGMICIRSEREAKPASRHLYGWETLAPEKLHTDEGIQIISHFLKKFRASGIISINEQISCWINEHRQMLPPETAVWLADNSVFNEILSKHRQNAVAKQTGMELLPTWLLDKNTNVQDIDYSYFPLCLRPDVPGGIRPSFKVHIVPSPEQLGKYLRHFDEIRKPIIAQPFMNLPNLVVHGTRTLTGNTIGLQAFLVDRKFEGVTLTIQPVDLLKTLRKQCIEFTDFFDLVGNYHFEFLFDPKTGKNWFLEINNRLGGTTAKVYPCAYDEPALALAAYGIPGNTHRKRKQIIVSSKTALLKYLWFTMKNRLTPLDYPAESAGAKVAKTLYGLFFYADDTLNLRDMKGTLAMFGGNLLAKLKN